MATKKATLHLNMQKFIFLLLLFKLKGLESYTFSFGVMNERACVVGNKSIQSIKNSFWKVIPCIEDLLILINEPQKSNKSKISRILFVFYKHEMTSFLQVWLLLQIQKGVQALDYAQHSTDDVNGSDVQLCQLAQATAQFMSQGWRQE